MMVAFAGLSSADMLTNNKITDEDITVAVLSNLHFDPMIPANEIRVKTSRGIVTLTGKVNNLLVKERAKEHALTTKGVISVVNDIRVKPVVKNDKILYEELTKSLSSNSAVETDEITLNVDGARVVLEGQVDSMAEKQAAEISMKTVTGVRDVINNIHLKYKTERPDKEIKTDIDSRLKYDVRVEESLIGVDVKDGKVLLTGSVGSAMEKQLAIDLSWVSGVKEISADDLRIKLWADEVYERQSKMNSSMTDAQIKTAVEKALKWDPRLTTYDIDVSVKMGNVRLAGTAHSLYAKNAAEETALNTIGTRRVRNLLSVKASEDYSDSDIEKNIESSLENAPYVTTEDLTVSVIDGIVTLAGAVSTNYQKDWIEEVVSRNVGVKQVHNFIFVPNLWEWKNDDAIKEDVNFELFWNPFVQSDNVNIKVNEGVVTLTGTVNSWSAMRMATTEALNAGAKSVINKLAIKE